jgi:hypothetical protein
VSHASRSLVRSDLCHPPPTTYRSPLELRASLKRSLAEVSQSSFVALQQGHSARSREVGSLFTQSRLGATSKRLNLYLHLSPAVYSETRNICDLHNFCQQTLFRSPNRDLQEQSLSCRKGLARDVEVHSSGLFPREWIFVIIITSA